MDPLLVLIGLGLTGTVTLVAVYAHGMATTQRQTVQRRVRSRDLGMRLVARSPLRSDRAGRFPIVERLPVSAEARARMQTELELAGKSMKVGEFLAIRVGSALLGALLGFVVVRAFGVPDWAAAILALAVMAVGWLLPRVWLSQQRKRRQMVIEGQLPEALMAIAKSLRAGSGLMQALAYAAQETEAPLGPELRSTLRDLQLGADPSEVFEALAARIDIRDLDIAVTAIVIQRQVGGNLSEILSNVTNTIRERAKLMAEVRVLTTRQRLTANMIAALPVLIAAGFIALNRDMGSLLFTETAGRIALLVGLAFEVLGIVLVRRLAVIEV